MAKGVANEPFVWANVVDDEVEKEGRGKIVFAVEDCVRKRAIECVEASKKACRRVVILAMTMSTRV